MQFNHYGGEAALLAADLLNLSDTASNDDDVADVTAALLRAHGITDPHPSVEQASRLLAWATHLAGCFGPSDLHEQVRHANELLGAAASKPYISLHGGDGPHLHYRSLDDDLVSRVQAITTAGLAYMICFSGGTRLGRCARPGCGTAFVDTSRNGRRRYCTIRCANTSAVNRHRKRRTVNSSRIRDDE